MERKIYTQSMGERAQPVVQPTISVASAQLPPIPTAGEREAIPTTGDAPNAHGQEIAVEKSPYAPDNLLIETVEALPELYTEFDAGQWAALVDSMTVHAKDRITFTLTCGMEIEA